MKIWLKSLKSAQRLYLVKWQPKLTPSCLFYGKSGKFVKSSSRDKTIFLFKLRRANTSKVIFIRRKLLTA